MRIIALLATLIAVSGPAMAGTALPAGPQITQETAMEPHWDRGQCGAPAGCGER